MGPLTFFLGLQVNRDRTHGTLHLHQTKFLDEILHEFGMSNIKSSTTPLAIPCKLSLTDCPESDHDKRFMTQFPYRQLLGKLRYLVTGTRLDICYSINFLSRFMHNPGFKHWKALLRVVRYLKFTRNFGLLYSSNSTLSPLTSIIGWSDSDWGGEMDTRRSTAGFSFVLAGAAVTWQSKKQTAVTLSTAEAEFVAVALATKEGLWIQMLIEELKIIPRISLKIYSDNLSCIYLASNPKHSEKTKHVDLKYHFIREMVESHKLQLEHSPMDLMWADFLTKSVPASKHESCCDNLGLKRIR